MTNIIEPCCAERQLGQLFREAHGRAALFQTNGDVTAKLFIKDTMLLSGDRPRTLTIAASEMPQEAMRLISRYASLGYIATLRLLLGSKSPLPTQGGAGGGSDSSLFTFHSSLNLELALLPDDQPIPELMMWRGSSHTVVIQGTMPDTVTPALHLYAGMLCGNQSLMLHAATAAFEALFRARRTELEAAVVSGSPADNNADANETATVPSAAVPQQPKQPKKTTHKKTTTDEHPEEMA